MLEVVMSQRDGRFSHRGAMLVRTAPLLTGHFGRMVFLISSPGRLEQADGTPEPDPVGSRSRWHSRLNGILEAAGSRLRMFGRRDVFIVDPQSTL